MSVGTGVGLDAAVRASEIMSSDRHDIRAREPAGSGALLGDVWHEARCRSTAHEQIRDEYAMVILGQVW